MLILIAIHVDSVCKKRRRVITAPMNIIYYHTLRALISLNLSKYFNRPPVKSHNMCSSSKLIRLLKSCLGVIAAKRPSILTSMIVKA